MKANAASETVCERSRDRVHRALQCGLFGLRNWGQVSNFEIISADFAQSTFRLGHGLLPHYEATYESLALTLSVTQKSKKRNVIIQDLTPCPPA